MVMSELAEQSVKGIDPSQAPTRRIYGLEQEFGTEIGDEVASAMERTLQYFKHAHGVEAVASSGAFLSNGARFYRDCGNHWEYAGAEAQSIADAVSSSMGGEEMLAGAVDKVFASDGQAKNSVRLNTRIIDDKGETWGVHENYLVARGVEITEDNALVLAAHLATRSLFTGAGMIRRNGPRAGYSIAQKIHDIDETISGATTRNKPLINTRDEPHATGTEFRRQHITSGDPCMLPWSAAMKLAGTSLVLRMIEHDVDLSHVILEDPVLAAKLFAQDFRGRAHAKTEKGEALTALQVQRRLAECAVAFMNVVPVSEEEAIMAEEWMRAIEDMERSAHDPRVLASRVDWAAKWKILRHKAYDEQQRTLDAVLARSIDLQWGDVSRKGLALWLRRTKELPDPIKILPVVADRKSTPPPGRAAQRGELIGVASMYRPTNTEQANWTNVKVAVDSKGTLYEVKLLDPYGEKKYQANQVRRAVGKVHNSDRKRRK